MHIIRKKSQHKRNNAPSVSRPVADEERLEKQEKKEKKDRPLVGVSDLCPSMLWHSSFWSVKSCANYLQKRFSCRSKRKNPKRNRLA